VPFKQVFDEAQDQLRQKFGMEMIELPSKEKTTKKARIGSTSPCPSLRRFLMALYYQLRQR